MKRNIEKHIAALALASGLFWSCGTSPAALEGFDSDAWKSDREGCEGTRKGMLTTLKTQKEQLKGMSNQSVVKVLGRPDKNELTKRNQKYFVYYLSPSDRCGEASASLDPLRLQIRFNAVGLAYEVLIMGEVL